MTKCLGCGINLQTNNKNELGFTTTKEKNLCMRCFRLKNYGEYQSVSLNNNDYQQIIKNIPESNLIIYITDVLSLNLTNLKRQKNTILVLTKYDILPKSTKEEKIITKLKKQYPNLLDIIIISSLHNYNLDTLYNTLNKHNNYKPIYLIGNTNSGKSTLLNKLIKNYDSNQTINITTSMYPSTTLDKVQIKLNKLTLIDTPGLIDEGSYTNVLTKEDLKKITPKKPIKPRSCQVVGKGSILIDKLARIDYETKEPNSFVIYTSPSITSTFISVTNNTYKDKNINKYFNITKKDLVLPGLGFIKFTKEINITIYTKEGTIPFIRDNLI